MVSLMIKNIFSVLLQCPHKIEVICVNLLLIQCSLSCLHSYACVYISLIMTFSIDFSIALPHDSCFFQFQFRYRYLSMLKVVV